MIKSQKLIVRLISHTQNPEQVVVAAIRQCYSATGAAELKQKTDQETQARLIKQVVGSGHLSTLEHASFTFAIEGISRVTEIQLIRHRLASFSIQSGRYVKRNLAKYRIPPKVLQLAKTDKKLYLRYRLLLDDVQALYGDLLQAGIPAEDARYCQPQSLQTKVVVTMNARELLHFFELRCCKRAQWEISELASTMLALVKKKAPLIFQYAGPTCQTQNTCYEGEKMSCGLWKTRSAGSVKTRVAEG